MQFTEYLICHESSCWDRMCLFNDQGAKESHQHSPGRQWQQKTSRNSQSWCDEQESWRSTLSFVSCWFSSWRWMCRGQFLVLPGNTGSFITAELAALSEERLFSSLQMDSLFYATTSLQKYFAKQLLIRFQLGRDCAQSLSAPSQLHSAPSYFVSAFELSWLIKNSDSLKISLQIINSKSGCHALLLSFKILGSILDLSLIQKMYPPLSECMALLNCKGDLWFCTTVHVNKTQIAFSGMSFAQSSFQDQILLVK